MSDADTSLSGLTKEEVAQRVQKGQTNLTQTVPTKSVKRIIRDNICTLFNLINVILAALVIAVGSYKNVLFMGVILCNTAIGIFQEIRAKRTVDRLSLISAPKAHVLRDGALIQLPMEELVLDDIMVLEAGQQVGADCVLLEGNCEMDESLLTGESDPIHKAPGEELLSGSIVVSGKGYARINRVGKDSYAAKILGDVKYIKKPHSEIMVAINQILKVIGIGIIPVGLLLFGKSLFFTDANFSLAIVSTVAALIGMIPEGLVLLTSVVLAVSVIRLSRHKTLVQELYCIETLARVDTLCLDKTGTITEGRLDVKELAPLPGHTMEELEEICRFLLSNLQDNNPTYQAMLHRFGGGSPLPGAAVVPFSSARKWSGVYHSAYGTCCMGAGQFLLGDGYEAIRFQAEQYSQKGYRVITIVKSPLPFREQQLPQGLAPIGLVVIRDVIRPQAPETLRYFKEQGVDIKIISGDDPVTVSQVARRAGLEHWDLAADATKLDTPEKLAQAAQTCQVFGRVTPRQKLELVQLLKSQGHTVAMTGDGVNDVLALREADCSIAMAQGSDAARNVSQLVLLDSNFASMPKVVAEGRRSINNIQRSSSLFLVKTIFSAILAVLFLFLPVTYPYVPIQLTMINALTIGAPSFILALEPNRERIKGRFIYNVICRSIPGAFTVVVGVVLMQLGYLFGLDFNTVSTMTAVYTGVAELAVLFWVCKPFNALRIALYTVMSLGFVLGITIPFTGDLFSFYIFDWIHLWTLVPFALAAWGMMWGFGKLTQKGIDRWELHEQKKLKSDSLSEPSNVFQEKT